MNSDWLTYNLEQLSAFDSVSTYGEVLRHARINHVVLHDLLLHGAQTGEYSPLRFHTELPISSQFQQLFRLAPSRQQVILRRSVIHAIANWTYPGYAHSALQELALLAAYFRAAESANVLVSTFDLMQDRPAYQDEESDEFDAKATIVSVLQGFAPTPEVTEAVERLLFHPQLDPRLAGHLVRAAIGTMPDRVEQWLRRYFDLANRVPDFHDDEALAIDVVALLPLPRLLDTLASLIHSPMSGATLLPLILHGSSPLLVARPHDQTSFIFRSHSGVEVVTSERSHFALALNQLLRSNRPEAVSWIERALDNSEITAMAHDSEFGRHSGPVAPRPELEDESSPSPYRKTA